MPRDRVAPDGCLAEGERIVRKGGIVLFAKSRWQDDRLIPFVGNEVTVNTDYYYTEVTCFSRLEFICTISKSLNYLAKQLR